MERTPLFLVQGTDAYVVAGSIAPVPAGSTIIASYYIYSPTAIQGLRSRIFYGSGYVDDVYDLPAGQWIRHTTTAIIDDTGTDTTFGFRVLTAMNSASTAVDVYIWGVQVETGSFATSLIPTSGTTVTRAADISTSNQGIDSFYNQSEGTVFVETVEPPLADTDTVAVSITQNGSNADKIELRSKGVAPATARAVIKAGDTLFLLQNLQNVTGRFKRLALAYKLNDTRFAANGVVGAIDTSVTIPTVNKLFLGNDTFQNTARPGHIRRLSYFPLRLPRAIFENITL